MPLEVSLTCQALLEGGAKVTGTLGEQGGRILMSDVPCGNLPNRVSKSQPNCAS